MTKTIVRKLAHESYTRGVLDAKKVERVAKVLSKALLKDYIKELRNLERKNTVTIALPNLPDRKEQKSLRAVFADKKIRFVIDPSLLLGLRVIDGDDVYALNLKDTLLAVQAYTEAYD